MNRDRVLPKTTFKFTLIEFQTQEDYFRYNQIPLPVQLKMPQQNMIDFEDLQAKIAIIEGKSKEIVQNQKENQLKEIQEKNEEKTLKQKELQNRDNQEDKNIESDKLKKFDSLSRQKSIKQQSQEMALLRKNSSFEQALQRIKAEEEESKKRQEEELKKQIEQKNYQEKIIEKEKPIQKQYYENQKQKEDIEKTLIKNDQQKIVQSPVKENPQQNTDKQQYNSNKDIQNIQQTKIEPLKNLSAQIKTEKILPFQIPETKENSLSLNSVQEIYKEGAKKQKKLFSLENQNLISQSSQINLPSNPDTNPYNIDRILKQLKQYFQNDSLTIEELSKDIQSIIQELTEVLNKKQDKINQLHNSSYDYLNHLVEKLQDHIESIKNKTNLNNQTLNLNGAIAGEIKKSIIQSTLLKECEIEYIQKLIKNGPNLDKNEENNPGQNYHKRDSNTETNFGTQQNWELDQLQMKLNKLQGHIQHYNIKDNNINKALRDALVLTNVLKANQISLPQDKQQQRLSIKLLKEQIKKCNCLQIQWQMLEYYDNCCENLRQQILVKIQSENSKKHFSNNFQNFLQKIELERINQAQGQLKGKIYELSAQNKSLTEERNNIIGKYQSKQSQIKQYREHALQLQKKCEMSLTKYNEIKAYLKSINKL